MALVLPILLVLMFGSVELGNYFLSEHVVQKAVRDASRYAARLPVTTFDCTTGTMTDATPVQRLARTGDPAGTTARLVDWTADSMTTVTVTCDTSGTYTGIYTDFPMGVPVVTVAASVPYTSLFGTMGLGGTLSLNASQQAAVIGA
jgi:Flp pilus assembly protein TadG